MSEDREGPSTRMAFFLAPREVLARRGDAFYAVFRGVLRAAEGLCTKNRAGTYGPPQSNFIHGDESYLEMLWVKMSRLINMVEQKRELLVSQGWQGWADFDRGVFADSLVDLINYAAFWAADVALADQWPPTLQAQPQAIFEDEVESEPLEDGVEMVQCPRCQSLVDGYFGRVDGQWVVGCKACGVDRRSQQVGGLLSWYAETRGSRSFVRGRYGTQGDLTHHVKPRVVRTTPPNYGGEAHTEDSSDMEELPPADHAPLPRTGIRSTRSLPQVRRGALGGEEEVEDTGPSPDNQPEPSEVEAVETVTCNCGEMAGIYLVRDSRKGKAKTCLRLTCPHCGLNKQGRDLREVKSYLTSQGLKKQVATSLVQE